MRLLTTLAAATLAAALLTSCSADEPDSSDGSTAAATDPATSSAATPVPAPTSETPTDEAPTDEAPAGQVLTITVDGDEVAPNGARLELAVGEPLTVEIDSDRAGELHVHSRPEQYVTFEAGASSQELVVERPGLVEVEDHDTGDVVAQIEVR